MTAGDGLLDEHHLAGAARQGLEPERARAREQVEAAGARDAMLQPVEQRLAHPVGRRPKPGQVGKLTRRPRQAPAMMRTALRPAAGGCSGLRFTGGIIPRGAAFLKGNPPTFAARSCAAGWATAKLSGV